MTRDEAWLAEVIRKAETAEECKLLVSSFLLERDRARKNFTGPVLVEGAPPSDSGKLRQTNSCAVV